LVLYKNITSIFGGLPINVKTYSLRKIINSSTPYTGLDRPLGLQVVDDPRISRQSANKCDKVVSPTHVSRRSYAQ